MRVARKVAAWSVAMMLVSVLAAAQNVPDAPSATRPPPQTNPFPAPDPNAPKRPATEPPPEDSATSEPQPAQAPAAPSAEIKTVPAGQAPAKGQEDELTVFSVTVNSVFVPVTVRDNSGRLVDGLQARDFQVLEDGVPQRIRFFTSDPLPLSTAVIIDTGMPDKAMRKVAGTLEALGGAFSQFDEVTLFTFANTVEHRLDWSAVTDQFVTAMKRENYVGRTGGVPVTTGPMAAGPTVNGAPFDPGRPRVTAIRREAKVLNDAILAAALDLAKRDRKRRKMIFIISDGAEEGSAAKYDDVLKVLLTNEIAVYAVAVDAAAIPVYGSIRDVRFPGMGWGNILPRYALATGGDVFSEFNRSAIETAYARLTTTARNQYTLGYQTPGTVAGNYRTIEVRVMRPDLRVYARDGYYPLPPPRQQNPGQ
ncbi:MAG TPA: VWA domain-containing protein [Terriglobales bacterium]|nr:VWA domain-containing protein [Terriglobales bacterium]